jgi:hypothetical protein
MLALVQEMSAKSTGPVILAWKKAQPTIFLPFSAKTSLLVKAVGGLDRSISTALYAATIWPVERDFRQSVAGFRSLRRFSVQIIVDFSLKFRFE